MKIIAGKFKGKNLAYRERKGLRVTSQKVKEAIFSMLRPYTEEAKFLDLYCGYGSLGIEAISRGAKHVTFVDVDGNTLKQLSFFLEKLEVADQAEIIKRDSIKAIKHMEPESFDVIIMDPPYNAGWEEKTLEGIEKYKILKPDGICVVEHSSDNILFSEIGKFVRIKTRIYGDTAVSVFVHQDAHMDMREQETTEIMLQEVVGENE